MKKILIFPLLVLSIYTCHAQLLINEFMQSNVDCIMDDLNDFPDSWVELYNSGNTSINLSEYKLGNTDIAAQAWQLPSKVVVPHQYVLIYCDKEAKGLHTDFKLDSGKGGAIYLFHNNTIEDKVINIKKQPAPDIAYGRQNDGSNTWGYQYTPTPGAANCERICDKILGDPVFSEPGKVVTGHPVINLNISIPNDAPPGTIIRVTYDGSEPTNNSVQLTSQITINSSRIIRAKLFCDGYLSPRAVTHSYIYSANIPTLPIISISTNSKYLNDNKIGIYVEGNYQSGKKNYEFNWRRPVNFEYFEDANQESKLNQLCETRIQGGASRGAMLKSLIIYANKRFGTKRLSYEFFPDQRPGITDFKSILLRNAGNDFDYLYQRDAIIQRTMAQNSDLDWQAWRPAIIYINGVYKGILNIRERSNEDNIYTHYDGLEDIDMIENWWELKEGDMENFEEFQTFYAEHGHTLQEYEKWIDWKEFINLMIMNLYYNNQDFPGNNIMMWRPRTPEGRWRFVAKDTDFGLGLYGSQANYKTFEWLYNPNYDGNRNWANQYEHTRLFRRMMEDADFKREFIDRTAIYMGDFLNYKRICEVWNPMYEMIKTEYPIHRKLINQWWPNYDSELSTARNWLNLRTDNFYNQIADYYGLGAPTILKINNDSYDTEGVGINFNGITLSKGIFDGKFFANRNITLEGVPSNGRTITGWKVVKNTNGTSIQEEIPQKTYSFNMPVCQALIITPIIGNTSGIDIVNSTKKWSWSYDGNNIEIKSLEPGIMVRLYDVHGMLIRQLISDGSDMYMPTSSRHDIYILKVGNESVKIH